MQGNSSKSGNKYLVVMFIIPKSCGFYIDQRILNIFTHVYQNFDEGAKFAEKLLI